VGLGGGAYRGGKTNRDGIAQIHTFSLFQIGLTAYLSLFQKSPEALSLFPFLKHLDKEDLEFYSQLQNHAVRVTGVISMLVKQVS